MGQCGKFCYALWATAVNLVVQRATAADLVLRYGPLREMKLYSKICIDFCAMGHSSGFGYAYGPYRRVWLSAMGRSEGFGQALWAMVQNLVLRYGP
jgi:hypothetical protein